MSKFNYYSLTGAILVCLSVAGTAEAISPDGSGGGAATTAPRAAPPPKNSSHSAPTESAPAMQESVSFPTTADEMRKALGLDKKGGTRDMADLDALGFGSFIEFATDSDEVIPSPGLRQISEALSDLEPGQSIEIRGHTDEVGESRYNQRLSERRADSVRAWLINHGVRPDALRAIGVGEDFPLKLDPSLTLAERNRRNRRVEFWNTSWNPR